MTRTTKAQRRAIFNKWRQYAPVPYVSLKEFEQGVQAVPLTYKQFRRSVQPTYGCDGAVTVPWCGMWLCIEQDGYCHS
jgi:hypothetical protein